LYSQDFLLLSFLKLFSLNTTSVVDNRFIILFERVWFVGTFLKPLSLTDKHFYRYNL
jgi:hypothetical protein